MEEGSPKKEESNLKKLAQTLLKVETALEDHEKRLQKIEDEIW